MTGGKPRVSLVRSPCSFAKSLRTRGKQDMHRGRGVCGLGSGCVSAALALLLVVLGEASAEVEHPCPEHLFVIERSKNANIVVYDANRGSAGDLTTSEPVVAYWLLAGEKGKREQLNAVERERAYGFDIAPGDTPGTFSMAVRADPKRRLTLRVLNDCPVVTAPIGGRDGILQKLFVQSKEGLFLPKVEYVAFFGQDVATDEPLYEKFIPRK
jgi:Domain of unknown function (DUF4833)